ncbi:MAG TPA: HAD-IA family hydrolase [Patescibacteria group bacterium]|nr:HAD-IA family hydrolase [Patescibacteria group bacterium]
MSSIIFDFDGTLADSLPIVIELFYEWSGLDPFSPSEIERMRNMSLKQVLAEVGIPLWKVPRLLAKARGQFGQRIDEVPVFAGMPEVIKKLHGGGHHLYVISSNSSQNIRVFLKKQGIEQYFRDVKGNAGLFGKARAIKSIMRTYNLAPKDCYAIGDETRDIDAAKKAGITSIAVNWGYNSDKALKARHPDHIVSKPAQISELLQ